MADRNAQILISLKNAASPEVQRLVADNRNLIASLQQTGVSLDAAERKMLALAQAEARARAATGDLTGSQNVLTGALGATTRESTAAYNAQTQLVNVQKKAAGETGGLSGALGGLKTALGVVGLAFSVQQVIAFGSAAAGSALQLRETQNGLRAIAGSVATYNQALATARQQQILFGGTLQENIEGLTGLTITARQSGASLQTLVDLSQRLAILDPSQGAAGARIALSEALSGDPTSLARRYEIPRAALAKLRDESTTTAAKLQIISEYLDRVGITSESVAGRVDATAKSYRSAGAALDNLKNFLGTVVADGFRPYADSIADAQKKVDFFSANLATFGDRQAAVYGITEQLTQATLRSADADDRAAQAALAETDIEQQRILRANAHAAALGVLANAITAETVALQRSSEESIADAAAKAALEVKTKLLAAQTDQAVASFLQLNPAIDAAGVTALVAAGKIDPLIGRLVALKIEAINSARELLNFSLAQGALGGSAAAQAVAAGRTLGGGPTIGAAGLGAGARGAADQAFAQNNALRRSEFQLRLAQATTAAQRIAILKEELTLTTDQVTKNGILAQIANEQQSKAKAHTGELGKQLNLEERIRDSKEAQYKAQLDLAELLIRDRQDRRKEDQELARAQRIQRSGRASQLFKDAAADAAALIEIERQQRALAIQEKGLTAGGTVINGRIYQSRQAGQGISPIPVPGGAPPLVGGGAQTQIGLAGLPQIEVLVTLDGQQIAANVVTRLRGGLAASQSAGAAP